VLRRPTSAHAAIRAVVATAVAHHPERRFCSVAAGAARAILRAGTTGQRHERMFLMAAG